MNKSYEHYWDEEVLQYTYQNPDKKITKARFNKILTKVWPKCMTMSNIINGFKATGLFPWDPNMIPEEAPSILTELPNPQFQNFPDSNLTLHSPITHLHDENDSDTDATFCDEHIQSPSLLVCNDENEISIPTTPIFEPPADKNTYKLLNYSSSGESKENMPYSPKPGPSGLQRPSVANSSHSDTSDIDVTQFHSNYNSSKRLRIYSSTSDSDNDNFASLNETFNR